MTDKQLVLESVRQLPDGISMEEIAERIEFLAAVQKGSEQIRQGKTIPHEEVKRQLAEWLAK
jgi:predicted transcriptional regulator